MPTELTRAPIAGWRPPTPSKNATTWPASETAATGPLTSQPRARSSRSMSATAAELMSTNSPTAPCSANRVTTAWPIPAPPPDTTDTTPSSRRLPFSFRILTSSREVGLNHAERAEVRADRVAPGGEQMPGARPGAHDLARPDVPPMLPGPVQQPGEAGERVAHGGAGDAGLDVAAVQRHVHGHAGQRDLLPVGDRRPVHEGRASPVVQARAKVTAGSVPVGEHHVADLDHRDQRVHARPGVGLGVRLIPCREVFRQVER